MKNIPMILLAAALVSGCGKSSDGQKTADQSAQPAASAAGSTQASIDDLSYQIRYADDPGKIDGLLAGGVTPNGHDKNGFAPLVMALQQGSGGSDANQAKIVEILIARGADVNIDKGAPLAAAAALGKPDLVRFLLDKGADANLTGADGLTPLMTAVKSRSGEIVSLLLERGADVTVKSADGRNAWKMAFDQAYTFPGNETLKIEELLRRKTNRKDIESLLRADKSRGPYFDTEKWLREHP